MKFSDPRSHVLARRFKQTFNRELTAYIMKEVFVLNMGELIFDLPKFERELLIPDSRYQDDGMSPEEGTRLIYGEGAEQLIRELVYAE